MDVAAATTEVQARGFDYLSSARILIALNNAKNAFEDFADWPWLETTITGTSPLTIADLKAVLYVTDTTNQNALLGLDDRDVVDLDPTITTAGVPVYWWLDGETTLKTYPTSASAQLSVRYIKYSPELTNGTPLIPVRYHPIWVDLAVLEVAKDDEDFGDTQQLVQDTNRRLQGIQQQYATRNRQNPGYQVVTGASDDW